MNSLIYYPELVLADFDDRNLFWHFSKKKLKGMMAIVIGIFFFHICQIRQNFFPLLLGILLNYASFHSKMDWIDQVKSTITNSWKEIKVVDSSTVS